MKTINGKGRSYHNQFCKYVKEGHPGCAVGCQPEFQKWMKDNLIETGQIEGKSVLTLMREFPTFERAFDVETAEDQVFLFNLQCLHDGVGHWNGDALSSLEVMIFCKRYHLNNPLENR